MLKWKFGLKTYLIATVCAGAVIGVVCTYLMSIEATRQRELLSNLRRQGAQLASFDKLPRNSAYDTNQLGRIHVVQLINPDGDSLRIHDISAIAELRNVEEVTLIDTYVDDLSPLSQLSQLRRLEVSSKYVSDLSPIADLANLRVALFHCKNVEDITPLESLLALEELSITFTQVDDITVLSRLTSLKVLGIGETPVKDISPLATLTELRFLDIGGTEVDNLEPLYGLANLRKLYIRPCAVSEEDIQKLAQQLPHCSIDDRDPLSPLDASEHPERTRSKRNLHWIGDDDNTIELDDFPPEFDDFPSPPGDDVPPVSDVPAVSDSPK